MAHRRHSSVPKLCLVIGIFTILASPSWSEDPLSEDPLVGAGESFDQFARSWMDSVNERSVPANPAIMIDGDDAQRRNGVVTVRKYGNEFTTELRATGREGAEYVGILHYSESIYNCQEGNVENCSEPLTVPVTEIFRYDDGRWIY